MVEPTSDEAVCLLDALPDVLLLQVLSSCDTETLLCFSETCSRGRLLAREPALWRRLLLHTYDLRTPAPETPESEVHRLLYRCVSHTLRARGWEPLPFRGVYSDGGVDDGSGDAAQSGCVWR